MFFNKVNLELYVTDDGLEVKIRSYTPTKSTPLTAKQVLSQLKKIGIRIDVDHDLINEVVTRAATGHDITDMTVLKGIPPRKKGEKQLRLSGNPDFPVFKAMSIGTLEILDKDIPGKDVFNQPILPSSDHKPQEFKIGKGCVFDKSTGNILAQGYAQVLLSFNEIKLKPLFRISPDKIKITSVIFHSDFSGKPITTADFTNSLIEMKVDENAVNHQAIESALTKAGKTKTPQITVVASGKPPVNGRDGYFEPSEAVKPPSADDKDLSARIDFREQSIFRTVKQGSYLGKIYPPKPGQDGQDVFGRVISARFGKNAEIYAGDKVEITSPDNADEGKQTKAESENDKETPIAGELIALESGMVVLEKNRISIRDFMRINGDVDYSTGNIRLETGSVEITGTVKEGFKVSSPGHILIRENVEEAGINALGNVEVGLGVIMKRSGSIKAGGTFRCKFAENAVIEAEGNIVFSSNLNNCRVTTSQSIISNGSGIVMGGVLRAGISMEVGQIGSDYEIRTDIFVGPNPENVQKLIDEKHKLIQEHKEIKETLVQHAMESKSGGLDDEQKKRTKELMDTYNSIQNKIKKMDKIIQDKGISEENAKKYLVKVKDIVYPGTTIHIAGKSLKLVETLQSPTFYYDYSKEAVVWK
ncbi:MAG: DUF342 domain-containing protein [Desulfonatronovibrio sp.]